MCRTIKVPEDVRKMAETFGDVPLYIVGGFVRNSILGIGETDIDLASEKLPSEVMSLFGKNAVLVNKRLGTVHIKSANGSVYEHTTFRRESYPEGGGHSPDSVTIGASMEEDAARRDFSMNALYADAKTGEVIDPTGRGINDTLHRIIRTTSVDPRVIMKDDGLRLLRMVRLAGQLDFFIDKQLLSCAKDSVDLLDGVSAERIYKELQLIFLAELKHHDFNFDGHRRALLYMKQSGLLAKVFPVFPYIGGDENDVETLINVYSNVPSDFTLRLAALLMKASFSEINTVLCKLKTEKVRSEFICGILQYRDFASYGKPTDVEVRHMVQKLGKEKFMALCVLKRAENMETGISGHWRALMDICEQMEGRYPISLKEMNVDGEELIKKLKLKPGRKIGEILNKLLAWCAERPENNNKELLLAKASDYV